MMHDIVLAVYYFEAIEHNRLEGTILIYDIKNPQFIALSILLVKRLSLRVEGVCIYVVIRTWSFKCFLISLHLYSAYD